MLGEETLIDIVNKYLQKNYSQKLDLSILNQIVEPKVTLKYSNREVTTNQSQNRYKILIQKSSEIIKKNIVDTDKVSKLSEQLFSTLSKDVSVLINNEKIRHEFSEIKIKIVHKNKEIDELKNKITQQCSEINDKEDILFFIQNQLKAFLQKVKGLKNDYDNICNIDIYTTINIDNVYKEQMTDQEDYLEHYEPLLEVMQRLKSNMIKLYQEITRSDHYDVPVKSLNFLANCRNLLTELQPFLISPTCSFNRLIFHVVEEHRKNLIMITKFYRSHIKFIRSIILDTFKSFFIGYVFVDQYRDINLEIKKCKQNILLMFMSGKQMKYLEMVKKETTHIQQIRNKMKELKGIMSSGADSFMRNYIRRKQCKKVAMILQQKNDIIKLDRLIKKGEFYMRIVEKITHLQAKQELIQNKMQQLIYEMEKSEDLESYVIAERTGKSNELEKQLKFKQLFLTIQENIIQVNDLQQLIQEEAQQCEGELKLAFFGEKIKLTNHICQKYIDIESQLLVSYENLRKTKKVKGLEANVLKNQVLENGIDFLENKIEQGLGYEITNEDEQSEAVKKMLQKVDKAQYLSKAHLNTREVEDLSNLRINLQCLLVLFEGSMHENILQSIIDKLDFEAQGWKENVLKVQLFMGDINTYIKDLKKIISGVVGAKVKKRVHRIIKDRIQLYEVIEDIYTEAKLIFVQSKTYENINIERQGVKLFDESVYKYVLKMFQFKNKLRTESLELQELLIPVKIKNYLSDEIYEPFSQRFNQYIPFTQQELLNLMVRLEHSLTVYKNIRYLQNVLPETINKQYDESYFSHILGVCNDLIHIRDQNHEVENLTHSKFVIHNYAEFKLKVSEIDPSINFAETIKTQLENQKLELSSECSTPILQNCRKRMLKIWGQVKQ